MGTLITDFSVIQVISSSTTQSSVILPSQAKGGDEISFEGPEEDSPVVSQPFKRRRNVKTNPSVFEGPEEASPVVSQPFKKRRNVKTNPSVFEEYVTSPGTSEENVSNR